MTWEFRKPEPVDVQGVCVRCRKNKQRLKSKGKYRAICERCHRDRHGMRDRTKDKSRGYLQYRKDHCECCGFIAVHECQLDVDHIDGDHTNDDPDNLQTLCANCHRLKTLLNEDWRQRQ